ncbi:hypothetical protein HDU87_002823 [Geranomyces variabilis]|uniref:Uncharacterized protein n=1 Tax=Geranomyces variabilis TaxID=109894 RepID=A0AAD5TN82_9FUNG|nr:hypothetical protein HDU87_002823 [Geranomyces variabilis]
MMDVDDPGPHRVIDMGMSSDEQASSQTRIPIPDNHVPKTLEELVVRDAALFAQMQEAHPEYSVILGFLELYIPIRTEMAQQQHVPAWRYVQDSQFSTVANQIRSLVDRPRIVAPGADRDSIFAAEIAHFYDWHVLGIGGASWAPWTGSLSALTFHYENCVKGVEPLVMGELLPRMRADRLEDLVASLNNWRDSDYGVMTREGNQSVILVRSRRLGSGGAHHGGRRHESANAKRQQESQLQALKLQLASLQQKCDDQAAEIEQRQQDLASQTRKSFEAWRERQIVELQQYVKQVKSQADADMANIQAMYCDTLQIQDEQTAHIAFLSEHSQTNAANAARFQLGAKRLSEALASAEGQLAKTRGRAGMFDSESAFNPREVTQEFSNLANSVRAFVSKIVPNPAAEGKSSVVNKIMTLFMNPLVGERSAGATREPIKKNALTACVNAVVGEILYNALVIPVEMNACNEFRNAATTLDLFPDTDGGGDLHEICEQRFYQGLCEILNPASHPVPVSSAAIAEPFCKLQAATAMDLRVLLSTFSLCKQIRNELREEITSLASAVVSLRCRARAVGMTFWFDVPRKPTVLKSYFGISLKRLDPTRVEALREAAEGRGLKTEFDETRMKTKSRTKTYAFAVFPGLMGDRKVAFQEEVWCN